MKRILMLILALCLVLSLCACGGETTEPTAEAATESTQEAPTQAPTEAVEVPVQTPTEDTNEVKYTVIVNDQAGMPIAGVEVRMGEDSGVSCITNEMGAAAFVLPQDTYKVTLPFIPMEYTYSSNATEFFFEEGVVFLTITLRLADEIPEDLGGVEDEAPAEDLPGEEMAPEG